VPLDHVALTVTDRERSAAFYAEHFGLTERVHDDAHLLLVGDSHGSLLALSQGASVAAQLPRTTHFGFRLPHSDDVLAARERFRAAGVEETEFAAAGPTRVQVRDPDGYRVEVYAF
jgi:catechol 2,3-dioxygenase-like lactoylglutathione lyase family enzyme